MNLEDFKFVADERLGRIEMSPVLQGRIIRECKRRKRPVGKATWIAAAACFVLMALSGATLLSHMQFAGSDGLVVTEQVNPLDGNLLAQQINDDHKSQAAQVNDSILLGNANEIAELAALEAPVSIGEYAEGIAPAENAEGLWGYVDLNEDWLIAPKYASVSPVQNQQATVVRVDGVIQTILFTKK